LIGIDIDNEAIERAKERLLKVANNFVVIPGNFKEIVSLVLFMGKQLLIFLLTSGFPPFSLMTVAVVFRL